MRYDIVPIGGLNTDDDPRHFQQGDYEEMRNLHTGPTQSQGDEGLVTSIVSNLELTLPNMGGATSNWLHLGVAVDEENDRAYILAYGEVSSVGYFTIYKHDIIANTFKTIFSGLASDWNISPWGSSMQKCYNPRIVDNKLIWTDNVNDIRQMDVDKMEATMDAGIDSVAVQWDADYSDVIGYDVDDLVWYLDMVYICTQNTQNRIIPPPNDTNYYDVVIEVVDVYLDPIDPNNFTLAALPPLIAPLAEYIPTPSVMVNQLKGKTWQFSYQYIYMDYRKSTFAPPSIVPPPSKEEDIYGYPTTDPSQNNTIRLQINTGNEQVRSIKIVARTSEDPSTWFEVDEIYVVTDKNYRVLGANKNIYVYFYNDKAGNVVPAEDVFTLFHYVPVRAKHMELIEGNRLAFGNITEGYSRIASSVTLELSWEDLSALSTQRFYLNMIDVADWLYEDMFDWLLRFRIPAVNPGACTFRIALKFSETDTWHYTYYSYNGTDSYPTTVLTGLQNALESDYPGEVDTCFDPETYTFCAFPRTASTWNRPYANWEYNFSYAINEITSVDKYPLLKTGATHAWAIIYRDIAGRITPLIGVEDMTQYIPFPTEDTSSNVGRVPVITFKLNHLPPPQAESYEIVYAGNKSTSWYLQLLGYNFSYGKKNHDDSSTFEQWDEYFRLRVKKPQDNTRDNLLNWSVEEYVWQKGDRIRIIGKVNAAGILTEINDSIYDVEIMAVFDDYEQSRDIGDEPHSATEVINEYIYFPVNPDLPTFLPASAGTPNRYPDNLWVEIYRPLTTESNLYYTTGMTFGIGTDVYGNRYHMGDVDQVLDAGGAPSTPATITNTSHDNWKFLRSFRDVSDTLTFPLWTESEYVSDFYYTNKFTSQGNPVPNIDSQQQNILTKRLRHGGQINIGSQVNQLAEFDYDDYLDLKDEHGPIEGLRLVGFVLKAIQYTKVVSIYISRQESFTASGEPQYLFTDKVFGSARPAMDDWGTRHPDSVIVHNRHLYFWDESEGVVVRDAANGLEPISDNKMKRYFIDKADTLKAYGTQYNVWVHFAFSLATGELFCLFGTGSNTQEIITFNETTGRWKHQFDVTFERGLFYWLGRRMFQVSGENVNEWWKGTNFNYLSGSTRTPKMVVYGLTDPLKSQVFTAVHVYMTGGRPQFDNLTIPAKATAGSGEMETNIYDVNIEEKEGVFYCQILNDINTPGAGSQSHKEMNGRKMRGIFLRIEMIIQNEGSPNDKVTLSNLAVISTASERSK